MVIVVLPRASLAAHMDNWKSTLFDMDFLFCWIDRTSVAKSMYPSRNERGIYSDHHP